jgi:predicted oxidoreductase
MAISWENHTADMKHRIKEETTMSIRTMPLGVSSMQVPVVAVGCLHIVEMEPVALSRFLRGALDSGLNFFDHADVYGGGRCEAMFADAIGMTPAVREKNVYPIQMRYHHGAAI